MAPSLRRCRFPIIRIFLGLLNVASTALTLLSGLRENPLLVMVTGRYDPIRARLRDGSINMEIARDDMLRTQYLTPLQEIGDNFRFVTAPKRNMYSVGEKRSVCMNVDSANATVMGLFYDDVWGKGARRVQMYIFSISAPKCKVLNLKVKWRDSCISSRKGNASACHQYIMENFETLQDNRLIQAGAMKDFGESGAPYLKCLGRPLKSFEFQTDLLTHQAYWAGAAHHLQIQTSDCRAKPLIRNPDWKWGLFEVEAVDDGSETLAALPSPGWFALLISALYSIVSAAMILQGIFAFFLQNPVVRYIPNEVRYAKDHRLARYVMPFMPAAMMLTEDERSIITFKGSLLIASDVWMNHWLYIALSIMDAVTNIRLTYCVFQLGTWYLMMKITPENFIFLCSALTKITWLMCLLHTLISVLLKMSIRSLRSMQMIRTSTRDKLEHYIDGSSMFLSFKLYNILFCVFLFFMIQFHKSPSFMVRQPVYKSGTYGGIPKIANFWGSELVCDLSSILLILAACGQFIGALFMFSRFRLITDNGVMRLLQKRYWFVGWDGLMASQMLGLDPTQSDFLVNGQARTKCSLGTLIQLLYQSGPSSFTHLAGDYIFTGGGFSMEPHKFYFPYKRAVLMGLSKGGKGSVYRKDGVTNATETEKHGHGGKSSHHDLPTTSCTGGRPEDDVEDPSR
ncbi:hypothetical protein Poli38472_009270 [Pythium oligandrum]|uniref:Uncharacterized protein n=1 Tax=Pythium oligandrum TaxID=41045 RepID=A0A8K1CLE7_PYTOL|nr:hypothetical protein Poli38472_009270 [Pythium oligandrum]|eukprot:TMW65103.1 hypothetical protein Poli38472_009270 [Pythium oligandrum]